MAIASLTSCTKEEALNTAPKSKISSNANFEEELLVAMEVLDENSYIIAKKAANNEYSVSVLQGSVNPAMKIVCEGSGMSFAKCCRDYVDAHGCIKITKKGEIYYGHTCD